MWYRVGQRACSFSASEATTCERLSAPIIPDLDAVRSLDRFMESMLEASLLQHAVRNMLTPALLSADMLLKHADPVVARQAEIVIKAIIRVVDRVG